MKESGHNVGLITSSSQDSADSFYYYQQALLDAGAKKVHWVPLDEALRKAKSAKDCEHLDQYLWKSVGEFDTARRYPDLHQQRVATCQDNTHLMGVLDKIGGLFFSGGD